MKKLTTTIALGVLVLASPSAFAASKYQIKVGSWHDAYVSKSNCQNNTNKKCAMVTLSCPSSLYMTTAKAKAVNNTKSKIRVFDRTKNKEICKKK